MTYPLVSDFSSFTSSAFIDHRFHLPGNNILWRPHVRHIRLSNPAFLGSAYSSRYVVRCITDGYGLQTVTRAGRYQCSTAKYVSAFMNHRESRRPWLSWTSAQLIPSHVIVNSLEKVGSLRNVYSRVVNGVIDWLLVQIHRKEDKIASADLDVRLVEFFWDVSPCVLFATKC